MYKTGIVVLVLIVAGKVTGFLKDILLTYFHGVSAITDAFFLANSIAAVLYMAIFASIPIVIIPVCAETMKDRGVIYSEKILRLFLIYMSISLLFAVTIWQFSPQLVNLFSGDLDNGTSRLTVFFISIMSATFVFSAAVIFFNAVQLSNKIILPFYITPIINNVIFLVGLMIFSNPGEFYIVLILGIFAWVILAIGNFPSVSRMFHIDFWRHHTFSGFVRALSSILPAILALYIDQINAALSIFFAAEIGDGAVTVMNYGNKLNGVFLSVFLVILTAIIFPRIAEKVAQGNARSLKWLLLMYFRLFILIGLPSVLLVSFFAEEFVSMIFLRGAFGVDAVRDVSEVFSIVIFGLILNLFRDLINRVFFAYKKISLVLYVTLVSLSVNFGLSYFWYEQYELNGLAYAGVSSLFFNVLVLIYLLGRQMNETIFLPVLKMLLALLGGVLLVFSCLQLGEMLHLSNFIAYPLCLIIYSLFVYVSQFGSKRPSSIFVQ